MTAPTTTRATRTSRAAKQLPSAGVVRTPRHLYYFNGQGPWPGVTSITGVLDAPALTRWKLEQVALLALEKAEQLVDDRDNGRAEAAVSYLVAGNTQARDRGSRIHATLEAIVRRHRDVPVHEADAAAVAGARAWLNERKVKPLEVEAFLIHETLGYGGTCDLIAEIDGETWLLDWKTGKSVAFPDGRVYEDMRLQLSAYVHAEFIARPADPERHPLPPVTRLGVVHVTDGGTRLYPVEPTEADWHAFRACLYVHGWRKGKAA